eukprot:RCo026762
MPPTTTVQVSKSGAHEYHEVVIVGDNGGQEMENACVLLHDAIQLRAKYKPISPLAEDEGSNVIMGPELVVGLPEAEVCPAMADFARQLEVPFAMFEGVMCYNGQTKFNVGYAQYKKDVEMVFNALEDRACKAACKARMTILRHKFQMHHILNDHYEGREQFLLGDFYSTMKVDNSVRLATAMDCESLLKFMVDKIKDNGSDVVNIVNGKPVTLIEVLKKSGIHDPESLTVEGLGLQPGPFKRFHRFDIFSKKHSRGDAASVELLHIFLKFSNHIQGRYFAELIKPLLEQNDDPESRVATEYKVPIFGANRGEWEFLAKWVRKFGLLSKNNRYIIQIPRILDIRNSGLYKCADLQEQLDNIFVPVWEASVYPEQYPEITELLENCSAINVISDETTRGQDLPDNRPPAQWPWSDNPPDIYFNYYIWANLTALNDYRARKGMSTLLFRPNCGEVGNLDHLVSGYLLADSINHGIRMVASPVLQYLYYIAQIGMCLSPLSNNGLYVPYAENPFLRFYEAGLMATLSTDDPLHFHHTREPVIEEYGIAAKIYRLTDVDLCEIARSSVLISGFPGQVKAAWLGPEARGAVPSIRLRFRKSTLQTERQILLSKFRKVSRMDPSGTRKPSINPSPSMVSVNSPSSSASPAPQKVTHLQVGVGPITPSSITHVAPPTTVSSPGSGGSAEVSISMEVSEHPGDGDEVEDYVKFQRVEVQGPTEDDPRVVNAVCLLKKATDLREKYHWKAIPPWQKVKRDLNPGAYTVKMEDGVPLVLSKAHPERGSIFQVISVSDFLTDINVLHDIVENVDVQALAYNRLRLLEHKFALHCALNSLNESGFGTARDFYKSYKVDTHVHMAAGMTAKQLLEFLIEKAEHHSDDIVSVDKATGKTVTLGEMLSRYNIDVRKLTVDALNVQADASLFERFDIFNARYNPLGHDELRTLVLKPDNYMGGRYFAELIKKYTFAQFEEDAYTFAENRISVYGKSRKEWAKLAEWFHTHGMASKHNKWLVQLPRAYTGLVRSKAIKSFGELLENFFLPLWEVSMDPNSNPILEHFLSRHMSGFDCVDNESNIDPPFPLNTPPHEWTSEEGPPYNYWMYYLWANLVPLNMFRARCGRTTFSFRPHCGESGSMNHLLPAFLFCDGIAHGINMRHNPSVEFLFYLAQIGVAVSPLSNTYLFLEYMNNPFPSFYRHGLNVSLSTDDPLQFHHTQEPLIEEYSIASKQWKLSAIDMCEVARSSVLQSGYDHSVKEHWLGKWYFLNSSLGNDARKSHVPDIRIAYRFEVYHDEINYFERVTGNKAWFKRAMLTKEEEDQVIALIEKSGDGPSNARTCRGGKKPEQRPMQMGSRASQFQGSWEAELKSPSARGPSHSKPVEAASQ